MHTLITGGTTDQRADMLEIYTSNETHLWLSADRTLARRFFNRTTRNAPVRYEDTGDLEMTRRILTGFNAAVRGLHELDFDHRPKGGLGTVLAMHEPDTGDEAVSAELYAALAESAPAGGRVVVTAGQLPGNLRANVDQVIDLGEPDPPTRG